MASAAPPPTKKDLTRCGICKEIINQPRSLQCLHTFCLDCLLEWSKTDTKNVTCPVSSCKKSTPMPSDGVNGLPENVFVASLIENSPQQNRRVPCVCCDQTDNVVTAKCLNCPGFLCQEGVDMHKKPLLRAHQVIRLEDVKSGKVDLRKLSGKKRPTCGKHEGQALWFFCETCRVLICQICTTVMHQKPEHKYVELESVVESQKKRLEELVKENELLKDGVEKGIQEANYARNLVRDHVKAEMAEIDKAEKKIKSHIEEVCRAERERLVKELGVHESRVDKDLSSTEDHFTTQKESLQTAINMANQVLQTGSDYDVASVYKQVSSALEQNCHVKPKALSPDATNVPKFVSHLDMIDSFTTLGDFERPSLVTSCVLEGRFGEKDAKIEPGRLADVRGIAVTSNGDIAIANNYSGFPVKIYSISGKFKVCLDEQSTNSWDVATMSDGQFFVTKNKHAMVFNSDGKYQSQFAAVSPAGVPSDKEGTKLKGIAVNNEAGKVIVGEVNKKYISIHNADGTHCNSFPVTVAPHYLAVTRRQGHIVVSPYDQNQGVQIVDSSGSVLHTINAPQGVSFWNPVGVCCSSNDDIFIFNRGSPIGIYRFSSSGSYLGCITDDTCNFSSIGGLTFSHDEEKLLVALSGTIVNIFKRNNNSHDDSRLGVSRKCKSERASSYKCDKISVLGIERALQWFFTREDPSFS